LLKHDTNAVKDRIRALLTTRMSSH